MALLKELKRVLKKNARAFKVLHPLHKAYRVALMRYYQARYGVRHDRIVFSSYNFTAYSDNPRYISERMHELRPGCDIVWLLKKPWIDAVQVPDYVRVETPISRKGLKEQATARFWVNNFRHTESIYLNPREQFYIQTWHGDRGFKRVGDDNEKLPRKVYRLEDQCAMMIAGSEFGAANYRTAFHYKGEILMDGCPRNDLLIRNDPAEAAGIRQRTGVPDGARILMYAPTYRDTAEKLRQAAVLDISRTLDHLESKGERWVCFCRAHYLNAGLSTQDDARIVDVSAYPEMAELLLITDMLITDYSSCGADFTLLRRPMFLYQADAEEYLRECRSFYFDMADSPFLIARSQEELERLIDRTDAEAARENGEALDRFFGTTETGHAADAVCRYMLARM